MNRNQYRALAVALFLLAMSALFPPRKHFAQIGEPPEQGGASEVHRGFLFENLYLQERTRFEGAQEGTVVYAPVQLDFQRMALETLLLASATGFALLILRSSRPG